MKTEVSQPNSPENIVPESLSPSPEGLNPEGTASNATGQNEAASAILKNASLEGFTSGTGQGLAQVASESGVVAAAKAPINSGTQINSEAPVTLESHISPEIPVNAEAQGEQNIKTISPAESLMRVAYNFASTIAEAPEMEETLLASVTDKEGMDLIAVMLAVQAYDNGDDPFNNGSESLGGTPHMPEFFIDKSLQILNTFTTASLRFIEPASLARYIPDEDCSQETSEAFTQRNQISLAGLFHPTFCRKNL